MRDFRAWYGLGQAYEILKMPLYSLYYYRMAQSLKPGNNANQFKYKTRSVVLILLNLLKTR